MRFLIIAPCPFFITRGKPIRVLNNTLALALEGHDLDVATYASGLDLLNVLPPVYNDAGHHICIHRVSERVPVDANRPGLSLGKVLNNVALYFLARRLLRRHDYDAIVAHDADGALIAMGLPKAGSPGLVYDMHGSLRELMCNIHHAGRLVLWIAERVERRLYTRADLILVNWPHLLNTIGDAQVTKAIVVLDRPPVTTSPDLPLAHVASHWKKSYRVEKLIIYVGNAADYQRVDLLIEMMAHLLDMPFRVTLFLVGPGLDAMQVLADKIPNADIRFPGPRSGDELAEILANADVALSARVTENYPPMKVISYLKAAVPVVATNCSAHRVMIDHGVNGLLVPATPADLAAATRRLLIDTSLHSAMRSKLLQQQEQYSIDLLREQLRAAFCRLPELAKRWAVRPQT